MIEEARLKEWEREIQLHREVSHPDVVRKNKIQNVTVGDMEDLIAALREANGLFTVAHLEAKNALDRADRAEAEVKRLNDYIPVLLSETFQKHRAVREAAKDALSRLRVVGSQEGLPVWEAREILRRALVAVGRERKGEGEEHG